MKKHNAACSGAKHDRVKATQKMTGDQLLESGSKYEAAKIEELPKELLDKAKVRNLLKRGSLFKNKELAKKKEEVSEQRKQRSRAKNLTLEELQEMSHDLTVKNDKTWASLSPADRLRIADLDKLSNYNFWKDLKVSAGFVDQLKLVLPHFWKENMEGTTKAFLKPLMKKHLDLVKNIAENKTNNALAPCLDLSNLDRHGRLAISVKHDATAILSDAREQTQRKRKAREAMFSSGGTKIATTDNAITSLQSRQQVTTTTMMIRMTMLGMMMVRMTMETMRLEVQQSRIRQTEVNTNPVGTRFPLCSQQQQRDSTSTGQILFSNGFESLNASSFEQTKVQTRQKEEKKRLLPRAKPHGCCCKCR
jgi:hypothetical protein